MSGFVALHRSIFEHPVFDNEPFTQREAWVWLIAEAAWRPRRVRVGRGVYDLQRGELVHAVRFMAKAWQWEPTRVWRFLKRLEKDGMIATAAQRDATHITICNYNKYQDQRNADETPNATVAQQSRNRLEEINNLTKEIDTEAPEIFDAIAEIAKVPPDDISLAGFIHGIVAMLGQGYSRETILIGSANAMRGKPRPPPWSYFSKCIESENERRSQPAKPEVQRGKPETLSDVANRMSSQVIDFGPKPGGIRSQEDGDSVRLLPQGGRE